jgi:hypothetical protein
MRSRQLSLGTRFTVILGAILGGALSAESRADTWCLLTNFVIDTYDHGGAYMHGTLNGGTYAQFIVLCGETNNATDCTTAATDRRLATALAAKVAGFGLNLYFLGISSCSDYQPYSRPVTIEMTN